ncbi:MAG: hypothetical protein E3J64_02975 [Anaerolineales bacterium]|nr:MAG: hypothetical protein E3J64_02975 [Anaerolineales bacterium]
MQTWKLMAAIVVTGGLLLLLLLLAANANADTSAGPSGQYSSATGEPAEGIFTYVALVGGTALLAGGAWIGTLERAGSRTSVAR